MKRVETEGAAVWCEQICKEEQEFLRGTSDHGPSEPAQLQGSTRLNMPYMMCRKFVKTRLMTKLIFLYAYCIHIVLL